MAKGSSTRGGPSRIRFIMVEADLQEGDLDKVTQVLQNAFRSPQVIPARPQVSRLLAGNTHVAEADEDVVEVIDEGSDDGVELVQASRPKAPRKARVSKVPNVMNDIDVKSHPSLKEFVAEYAVQTTVDKYLVIALWFRDARATNSITVDHIYTCFRLLGWSTASSNFSKPLSNLQYEQALTGDSKGYSLSLLGAGKIEDKKKAG